MSLNKICHFQTREGKRVGPVSNSELRRWIQNGAIEINGEKVQVNEEIDFPINSVILFPKNKITLW